MTNKKIINNSFLGINPVGSHNVVPSTGLSTAVTLSIPEEATGLIFQSFGADVYFTLDGTDGTPTPASETVGFTQSPTDTPTRIDLQPGMAMSVFSATGSVQYQFFKVIDHNA